MRKTKIVCTIGPASTDRDVLIKMCKAGMNVARLNFSHGSYEEHQKRIDLIKEVREELNLPIAIMLDTKGPEYRIGKFENEEIYLSDGDSFTLTSRKITGNDSIVSVNYENLPNELATGDKVLINNGLVILEVLDIDKTEIHTRVIAGGKLSNKKSMNIPGKVFKHEYLSDIDKQDLLFGIKNDIDFVAASFVSNKEDVISLRSFLNENGGKEIDIIAKIENRSGVDNIEDICSISEGIMVARGDLGVEVNYAELPAIQKNIITKCRLLGNRVITATEMLESMITNPRPTRAEISDVANAVYDGTSAVMLSAETAAGKYPVQAIDAMSRICKEAEKHIDFVEQYKNTDFKITNQLDAISHATCGMAIDINAKAIAVSSISGTTVRMVSRFRVPMDIIGAATNKKVWYKLSLSWGVIPILTHQVTSIDSVFDLALSHTKDTLDLKSGDAIVLTGGKTNGKIGNTNLVKIANIK